jgi:hypothetical protein
MSRFWVDLSPPHKSKQTNLPLTHEINAIAGTEKYTPFAHALAYVLAITKIAVLSRFYPGVNARFPFPVDVSVGHSRTGT